MIEGDLLVSMSEVPLLLRAIKIAFIFSLFCGFYRSQKNVMDLSNINTFHQGNAIQRITTGRIWGSLNCITYPVRLETYINLKTS